MWHVSVARFNSSGRALIPTARWGIGVMNSALRLAMEALEGVGNNDTVASQKKVTIQLRRSLSDEEIGTLSAAWLAIPATDAFAEDGEVEERL